MTVLVKNLADGAQTAVPDVVDVKRSYERYFETGLYGSRYPIPNPNLLRLVLDELGPRGGRILDFGCGSGRYALPLAQRQGVSVFAYDICHAATEQLRQRCAALENSASAAPQLEVLCGGLDDLVRRLADDDGFDLAVMLFGVLGHIEYRARRVATLRTLRDFLRPGGRLIVTVPNRARRFLAEQKATRILGGETARGDVRYRRGGAHDPIELYYHLYDRAELCGELTEAGYQVSSVRAESVLTERMVLSTPLSAAADRLLSRFVPVSLAYGMVAVARQAG